MPDEITHYREDNGIMLCVKCGPKFSDAEPQSGKGYDYADIDYAGESESECESCGEYIFPEEVKELEAERAYYEREYRSGRLGAQIREQKLAKLQQEDPVAFYINCKDNPDAIENALDEM